MGEVYERPAEADGLRPGQAAVLVLGGTRPEHITATLVDLAVRGHLAIGMVSETGWELTKLPAKPDRLLRYEKELVLAVFGGARTVRLAELPESRRKAIGEVHRLLSRDALERGAIRPHYSEGPAPDLRRMRAFRDRLRAVPPAWRSQHGYLPYAIAFGFGPQWAQHVDGADFGWLQVGNEIGGSLGGSFVEARWLSDMALGWATAWTDGGLGSDFGGYGGGNDFGGGDGGHQQGGW